MPIVPSALARSKSPAPSTRRNWDSCATINAFHPGIFQAEKIGSLETARIGFPGTQLPVGPKLINKPNMSITVERRTRAPEHTARGPGSGTDLIQDLRNAYPVALVACRRHRPIKRCVGTTVCPDFF